MLESTSKSDTISGLAYLREFVSTDDMLRPVQVQHSLDGGAVGGLHAGGASGLLSMGVSQHCFFSDMKLCTTVEELDLLEPDHNALNFQVS